MLAGLGLAFVAAPERPSYAGERDCVIEGDCTFRKPNLMIMVDYSSSMNEAFGESTRWATTVDAIVAMIDADNGFLADNLNVALMRFGHDPDPEGSGTTLLGDLSVPPIVDGQALDVHWYDLEGNGDYLECNGEAVKTAITELLPPACLDSPMGNGCSGIGTWTKGALDRTRTLIADSRALHGESIDDRLYLNLILTDGAWTGPDGSSQDPSEDPAITAADLYDIDEVPTYVVAVSTGANLTLAGQLAAAGGTVTAIDGSTPGALVQELQAIVAAIKSEIIEPECVGGMPRIMIILDASSSMLNVDGTGMTVPGESGWDQSREALAGTQSIFDIVAEGSETIEDLTQLGLLVFGSAGEELGIGEERVLVDYGPCMKDNFAWALDPWSSCLEPGCFDPYAGPPIEWTYRDGSAEAPFFDAPTFSHMPQCYPGSQSGHCGGSGTYTHRGLELASQNQMAYAEAAALPQAPYPAAPSTTYANILITDGDYGMFSTDAEVQNALEEMYARGITTYVLGFGEYQAFEAQLDQMQRWGSGDAITTAFTATDEAELQTRLTAILSEVEVDPCCGFNDCSVEPEPTTDEPDTQTSSSSSSSSSTGSGTGPSTGGSGSASGGDDETSGGGPLPADSTSGVAGQAVEEIGCACQSGGVDPRKAALWGLLLVGLRRRRHGARGRRSGARSGPTGR